MANYADLSTSHLVVELANRGLRKSGIKSDLVSRLEEDDKKKNSTLHRISGHTLGLSAGHIPYLPVESLIEEISRNNYSRNDPKYQHIKAEAETFLKVLKLTNDRDEVVEDVNSTWRAGVKEILDQRDIDLKAINNLKLLEMLSANGFFPINTDCSASQSPERRTVGIVSKSHPQGKDGPTISEDQAAAFTNPLKRTAGASSTTTSPPAKKRYRHSLG